MTYVPSALGGTLDVDIEATIKRRKIMKDGNLATLWTNSSEAMAARKVTQLERTALFLSMENVGSKD